MYNKLVIGLDQSYTSTGISIAADNELLKVTSIAFKGCKTKSDKRKELKRLLTCILELNASKAKETLILCERIRTFSHVKDKKGIGGEQDDGPTSFLSTNYIKATGALIAIIVDTAYDYGVNVYSVDTRSWKSKIVGTTKGSGKGDKSNKMPTVQFVQSKGFDVSYSDRKGNTKYDDDAADSACIALYGFIPASMQSLKKEE